MCFIINSDWASKTTATNLLVHTALRETCVTELRSDSLITWHVSRSTFFETGVCHVTVLFCSWFI
jgi:hypothetical protein